MSLDLCPLCGRAVVEVLVAADVPLPFLIEPNGQRWHVGCVSDHVLPNVRETPAALATIRIMVAINEAEKRLGRMAVH